MKEFLRQNVKKCKKTITVYTMPDGSVIEAYKHKNTTEFYIHHKDYGIKMFMFGFCSNNCDEAKQEEIVYENFIKFVSKYESEWMAV